MKSLNSEEFIENLLNINLSFTKNLLIPTKFNNEKLEEIFKNYEDNYSDIQILISNIIIIIGYLSSFLYIYIAFHRVEFLIICFICLSLTIILIFCSKITHNRNYKYWITHLLILLNRLNLSLKGIILSCYHNTQENDNTEEILRIIIYDFVSTNLYILIKFDSNIIIYTAHFLINLFTILVSHHNSNKNHYFFLDGLTSFFLSVIFYSFRKAWDHRIRVIFSQKFKFENYFIYTMEFINGINGLHFNYHLEKKEFSFTNKKILILLNEIVKSDYDKFHDKNNLENRKNQNIKKISTKRILDFKKHDNSKISINNFDNKSNLSVKSIIDNKNQNIDSIKICKNEENIIYDNNENNNIIDKNNDLEINQILIDNDRSVNISIVSSLNEGKNCEYDYSIISPYEKKEEKTLTTKNSNNTFKFDLNRTKTLKTQSNFSDLSNNGIPNEKIYKGKEIREAKISKFQQNLNLINLNSSIKQENKDKINNIEGERSECNNPNHSLAILLNKNINNSFVNLNDINLVNEGNEIIKEKFNFNENSYKEDIIENEKNQSNNKKEIIINLSNINYTKKEKRIVEDNKNFECSKALDEKFLKNYLEDDLLFKYF